MNRLHSSIILALEKGKNLKEIIQRICAPKHPPPEFFDFRKLQLFKFQEFSNIRNTKSPKLLAEHKWVSTSKTRNADNYNDIVEVFFDNEIRIDLLLDDYYILVNEFNIKYHWDYEKGEMSKEHHAYFDIVNEIKSYGGHDLLFIFYEEGYNPEIGREVQYPYNLKEMILDLYKDKTESSLINEELKRLELALEVYLLRIIEDTGLSRKEIVKLIDYTKNESDFLISNKQALIIIAKDLCIDIENKF
ncbi:hypothetical protein LCGC14_1070920 [marine sediment metagenome]|uniref:Uncharacterized protein n=1 Tax=marine sediment metagenome TaxID=412755 RepID=A0A0F9QP39_9ZZZZ